MRQFLRQTPVPGLAGRRRRGLRDGDAPAPTGMGVRHEIASENQYPQEQTGEGRHDRVDDLDPMKHCGLPRPHAVRARGSQPSDDLSRVPYGRRRPGVVIAPWTEEQEERVRAGLRGADIGLDPVPPLRG